MSLKNEFRIGITQREVAFGQDCKALIAEPGIDPEFLAHALKARSAQVLTMVDEAGHGTGRLPTDQLSSLEIGVPDKPEQRGIVEVLDSVNESIHSSERLIAKRQGLLEALLLRALDDGLQWATWLSMGQLATSTMLGTTRRGIGRTRSVPLIKMGNLRWGEVDLARYEEVGVDVLGQSLAGLQLASRDLLFNTRNTPDLVGKTAVWPGAPVDAVSDNNILRIRLDARANPYWVCCYMTRTSGQRAVTSLATGTTSVAAIYWRDLRKLPLPIPPPEHQQRLEKLWRESNAHLEKERLSLRKLQKLKQGLMGDLLTGRVRIGAGTGTGREDQAA